MSNQPSTIFLAEEDEDDCIIFLEALQELKSNHEVVVSRNYFELIENLEKRICPLPCVLFIDWKMAKEGGLNCLPEISSMETLRNIPIVILSSTAEIKDINQAYHLGANYYIPRPERFSQFVEVIEKVLLSDLSSSDRPSKQSFILQPQN